MIQVRLSVAVLAVASSFVTLLIYWLNWQQHYHWSRYAVLPDASINLKYSETDIVVLDVDNNGITEDTLKIFMRKYEIKMKYHEGESILQTPGCSIPKLPLNFTTSRKPKKVKSCGKRAVFLKRLDDGDKIQVLINSRVMKTYLRKTASFNCCYQYIATGKTSQSRSNICEHIRDGDTIILKDDFIKVKCSESAKNTAKNPIYEDHYAFTKYNSRFDINRDNLTLENLKKYNVLLFGMDSMSLERVIQTMPETFEYFKENSWLSLRGFHKIDDNTFPNLMATLTGEKLDTVVNKCFGNIDECKDIFVWDTFKRSGYATAYGEDYLRLPDTFNKDFKFKEPPTDHYMRTFFLRSERELNDKSLVCTGKIPSGQHILNYARDFTHTYRAHNFFGVFWINSFSHNANSDPQDADKMFLNFYNQLSYSGMLENTFVVFFSDHGIRFGANRLKMESYYDERLPMLFISVPISFKTRQFRGYKSLVGNQFKLVTPYDLHKTLLDIHHISLGSGKTKPEFSDICPKCHSLFYNVSPHRTCKNVQINDKWCACHKLFPLDTQDVDAKKALDSVVQHIARKSKKIPTRQCWKCTDRTLDKFLRIHYYYENIDTALFFVLAFTMSPGNTAYEATVEMKDGDYFKLLEPINAISPYSGLGKCTINPKDRLFCVCQKVEDCQN